MTEDELLVNWGKQKVSGNYRRLLTPCDVDFEFTRHRGHPSSYAYVRFACIPANEISLNFSVEWPAGFTPIYVLRIKHSIAEGILDVLFSKESTLKVYRGCALRLIEFGWDDVGGSESAVYQATARAIERLKNDHEWGEITGRYRMYQ